MKTLELIYEVIDEMNSELEADSQIQKNPDSVIFGQDSVLDSMGLIHFITAVEEKLEEQTGNFISIADEKAMSLQSSPFKTVGTLRDYLNSLLQNK